MTRIEKILMLALVAVLSLAGLGGFVLWQSWGDASADLKQMKTVIADQQKIITASNERIAQAQTELTARLRDIDTLRRTVTTPVQIIREIPQQIPGVQPIIVQPAVTPGQPAPPPVAQIPIEQLKPLLDFALVCKETQANLAACVSEKKELDVQLQAVTVERDAAVKASKGGSRWSHVKSGLKGVLVGGGIVAILVAIFHG